MIEIIQRESFAIKLIVQNQIKNDAGVITSTIPVNLEGRTCNFIVKNKDDKALNDVKARIDRDFILTGTDAKNGIIYVNISSNDTNLPVSEYNIQVETFEGTEPNRTYYPHYQDVLKITNNLKKDN